MKAAAAVVQDGPGGRIMVGAGRDGRWRSRSALAAVTLLAVVAGLLGAAPAAASHDVGTGRVSGADRYATAAELSHAWDPAQVAHVLVARGDAFPDGLAAAALAGQVGAPLLLVGPDLVPEATRDALARLDPQQVVLLGGTAAIDDAVAAFLAADYTVDRIAGADRYATAAQIARRTAAAGEVGSVDGRRSVFIASGAGFPDALAAGAAAANTSPPLPVLLTRPDRLPTATVAALTDLGVEQAFVVGGDAAVATGVTDALGDLGVRVERLAGPDRQATAARVADFTIAHSDATGTDVVLARGDAFPDALAAGPTAGRADAPLVLTAGPDRLGATTTEWFDSACLLITNVTAVGGTAAITEPTLDAAATTVTGCHGTWGTIPDAPITDDRIGHSATWTGDRMIIWSGEPPAGLRVFDDGAGWDPTTREWRQLPPAPIDPRPGAAAAWTGEELLVWGGYRIGVGGCFTDGARYDPVAGTWQRIPSTPGGARCDAATVWTGEEFIVYGGVDRSEDAPGEPPAVLGDAVAYDPATDTWRTLPDPPLAPRSDALSVWTGDEVIVLGGHGRDAPGATLGDGAAYDPVADAWRPIPDLPEQARIPNAGAWIGDELVVLAGDAAGSGAAASLWHAAAYDPTTDTWRLLSDLPEPQLSATVTVADDRLYVLGQPLREDDPTTTGFVVYRGDEDRWVQLPTPPAGVRTGHTAVWTGAELLVWGGSAAASADPQPVTWRPPAGG